VHGATGDILCEVGDRDADGSIIDPIKLVGVKVTRLGMCSPTNQPKGWRYVACGQRRVCDYVC
jgi:hypothetical protein